MKENISDIMNELQIGQVLIFNNKRYAFVEAKKSRAVIRDIETQKEYLIKGLIEVTPDIDKHTVELIEEEAIKAFQLERKIKAMTKGQHFIGQDNEEYILEKTNRSTVDCKKASNEEKYRAKFSFVKNILEKNS